MFNPLIVTGAAGFIGACAVRRLVGKGVDPHVLLQENTSTWRLRDILDCLHVHHVDLTDTDAVDSVFRRIGPAAVLHFATLGGYEWQSDARRILQMNVLGSYNVLQAALGAGTKVFVNMGSSSEYGYRSEPMKESDRLEPNSVYAVAKAAQTHLARLAADQGRTSVVTFRLFSVYGPWEEPTRLMPTVIRRTRTALPLVMASPDTARDFVYVDDVLDALLDLNRLVRLSGEVFNLGTGVQSTLTEVVAIVQEILGTRSEVRWEAMPARRWDTTRWQADVSKARRALGWLPRHSLREGVARMAEWMSTMGPTDYGGE